MTTRYGWKMDRRGRWISPSGKLMATKSSTQKWTLHRLRRQEDDPCPGNLIKVGESFTALADWADKNLEDVRT